jgi:hypothetical protein
MSYKRFGLSEIEVIERTKTNKQTNKQINKKMKVISMKERGQCLD